MKLVCKEKVLQLEQTRIMGVLNVTPDSFSDGGKFTQVDLAVAHALQMTQAGASIIDVGGESTRPGALTVSTEEELHRVIPVIEAIKRECDVVISIDTSKPQVMEEAVNAGAHLINDVNALQAEGALETAKRCAVPVCIMHKQGQPKTMQQSPHYHNVVEEVYEFLQERIAVCESVGLRRDQILIDPGFGFGKSLQHNLSLLKQLDIFHRLKLPLLVGFSRKSMIEKLLGQRTIEQRLAASIALAMEAVSRGAQIIRVHDVQSSMDALRIRQALAKAE